MTHTRFLLALLCLVMSGCDAFAPPVKVDLSTPRSAAMEYLRAVQRADARAAHAASFGGAEQLKWVDGRIAMIDGLRKFDNALYARFGRVTSQVHTDMHDLLSKLADIWVPAISDGTLISDEQSARIDPKAGMGFFARSVTPIYLAREKQSWRVDLAQTYAFGISPGEFGPTDAEYHQWLEYGQIFQAVAGEVSSGRYKTPDAATQALTDRIGALLKSEGRE